jgi:DNA-binding winged helix-turn-helix (wHTH) protein
LKLSAQLPYLEVQGPDESSFTYELAKERVTIGRLSKYNDIALEPDPQQLVTRVAHCSIERIEGGWWLVDNGSVNKTFLQSDQEISVVEGRASLQHKDVIRILGKLSESDEPKYWEITFNDPMKTLQVIITPSAKYLEYDWIQARLYRVDANNRIEIGNLRPQEHKLIRYMDQRNRANGNVPAMCTYDELINAIWGDESFGHNEGEINRLIWELRQKVEFDQKDPHFIETVRGLGYRLITRSYTKL